MDNFLRTHFGNCNTFEIVIDNARSHTNSETFRNAETLPQRRKSRSGRSPSRWEGSQCDKPLVRKLRKSLAENETLPSTAATTSIAGVDHTPRMPSRRPYLMLGHEEVVPGAAVQLSLIPAAQA